MKIFTIEVSDPFNQHVSRTFFREHFKATDRKRAFELAQDKLWSLLMDNPDADETMVETIVAEAEYVCCGWVEA